MPEIAGWTVMDDYQNPLKSTYRLHPTIESAVEEAKARLRSILTTVDPDDKYDEEEVKELFNNLSTELMAYVDDANGGWNSDCALVKIVPIYK